MKLIQLSCYYF